MPWTARPGEDRRTTAILGAFCLFLSTVEYLIPKPMPFMRIGIANLPLMLALDILPFGGFLLLALIKVIGQGLITGTLFSYVLLFSLAGTCVSALSMFALRKVLGRERISMAGISVLGALLSNAAQLVLARLFVFGESVRYITPPFLAMGAIAGLALGLFCEHFMRRSRWYAERAGAEGGINLTAKAQKAKKEGMEEELREVPVPSSPPFSPANRRFDSPLRFREAWEAFRRRRRGAYEGLFGGGELCLAGLLMMPALVFNPSPYLRAALFLFFLFLAWLAGKRNNFLVTIVIILSIVAFNLTAPYGRVLLSFGVFRITEGALLAGLQRAVTLEGLIMLSRVAIRRDLRLPGSFGALIGESFRALAFVQDRKNTITRKNFVGDVDNLMLELSGAEEPDAPATTARQRSTARGRLMLIAVVLLTWASWAWL